jgi:hypothetical protein
MDDSNYNINLLNRSILTSSIHQSHKKVEMTIESKHKLLKELYTEIQNEVNKVVICKICKRKFVNQMHYMRHCNCSQLHMNNIKRINTSTTITTNNK